MVQFDPNLSMTANWKEGDILDDVPFIYAPPDLLKSYKQSEPQSEIHKVLRTLFELNLIHKLAEGDISMLALNAKAITDGVPIIVPPNYFEGGAAQVFWEEGVVEWNELRFVQATVLESNETNKQEKQMPKANPGPVRMDKDIAVAIWHLREEDSNFDKSSQKSKIIDIQLRLAAQNPARFEKNGGPSPSTIKRFLAAEGSNCPKYSD